MMVDGRQEATSMVRPGVNLQAGLRLRRCREALEV
jgi:hypothetical protein